MAEANRWVCLAGFPVCNTVNFGRDRCSRPECSRARWVNGIAPEQNRRGEDVIDLVDEDGPADDLLNDDAPADDIFYDDGSADNFVDDDPLVNDSADDDLAAAIIPYDQPLAQVDLPLPHVPVVRPPAVAGTFVCGRRLTPRYVLVLLWIASIAGAAILLAHLAVALNADLETAMRRELDQEEWIVHLVAVVGMLNRTLNTNSVAQDALELQLGIARAASVKAAEREAEAREMSVEACAEREASAWVGAQALALHMVSALGRTWASRIRSAESRAVSINKQLAEARISAVDAEAQTHLERGRVTVAVAIAGAAAMEVLKMEKTLLDCNAIVCELQLQECTRRV